MNKKKFWANLTDRQKDMRVLFFESDNRLPRQEGAGAAPRHWTNLTDDEEQDREKFFAAQEDPPERPKSWSGITDEQDQDREKFFAAQESPPERPKSWTGITDEQDQDRGKFFASQEDQPKHWASLTDDRKQQREAFFASNNPSGPGAAFWSQSGLLSSKWDADLVFQFTVTAPALGLITGEFKSVRGLVLDEWEYESFHEGGDIGAEHLLPKYRKAGRLVLERALRHPDPFVIWCLTMDLGMMVRQPVTVTLLSNNVPAAMWIIPECMPVKIEWSDLDAMTSDVATSTVELAHTGLIPIPM